MQSTWRQLRDSGALLILTLLSAAYSLVDQAFAAQISSAHVYAQGLLTGVAVVAAVLARILGQTIMVSRAAEDWRRPTEKIYAMSLPLFLVLGGAIALRPGTIGLADVAGIELHAALAGLSSWLVGYSLLLKFQFLGTGRLRTATVADVIGNVVNVVGNVAAMNAWSDPSVQFPGLVVATVVSQAAVGIYLRSLTTPTAEESIRDFWRAMRSVVIGEGFIGMAQSLLPTLAIFICGFLFGDRLGAALSVGLVLGFFCDRPFTANLMVGVRRLSLSPADAWTVVTPIKQVMWLWMIVAAGVVVALPTIVQRFYGLTSGIEVAVALSAVGACMLRAASSPAVAYLKSVRRHVTLSRIEWCAGDSAVCLGLTSIGLVGGDASTISAAVLVPACIWTILSWSRFRSLTRIVERSMP